MRLFISVLIKHQEKKFNKKNITNNNNTNWTQKKRLNSWPKTSFFSISLPVFIIENSEHVLRLTSVENACLVLMNRSTWGWLFVWLVVFKFLLLLKFWCCFVYFNSLETISIFINSLSHRHLKKSPAYSIYRQFSFFPLPFQLSICRSFIKSTHIHACTDTDTHTHTQHYWLLKYFWNARIII